MLSVPPTAPKCRCWYSDKLLSSTVVSLRTEECCGKNPGNWSFLLTSSAWLWNSSRYWNTSMRIIRIFKYIQTYRAIYVLFKCEQTCKFTLPFCSAANLCLAQTRVTYWNSGSGECFAQGLGGREELWPWPQRNCCMGKEEQGGEQRCSVTKPVRVRVQLERLIKKHL